MIIKNNWEDKDIVEAVDLNALANGITSLNVYNEDMSALCNGVKTNFSTVYPYEPGTLRVHLNGLRKRVYPLAGPTGGHDYTETIVTNAGTGFIFYIAPASTCVLLCDYQRSNQ